MRNSYFPARFCPAALPASMARTSKFQNLTLDGTANTRSGSCTIQDFMFESQVHLLLLVPKQYSRRNLVMPIFVFCENVVVIAISELRPGSNERYGNSTFYGPFSFLIFILICNEKQFCKSAISPKKSVKWHICIY